jgi:ketosteroid isomerase-like protein
MFASCNQDNAAHWEQEIMDADIAFSNYSVEHGSNAAFLHFATSDVVLLKSNMMPIVGHQKLEEFYTGKSDSAYTLKWKPLFAKVSKQVDLGYTYGVWELFLKAEPENIRKGTYLTIWEHQPDGQWKFVLDTGNQGLGE